jgi:DNA-binding beta-propeller fold protein YncE
VARRPRGGRRPLALLVAPVVGLLAACGSGHPNPDARTSTTPVAAAPVAPPPSASAGPAVEALVTDETQNRLLVVRLADGRVVRRVPLPPDPEDIAGTGDRGMVLVVSSRAGKVTALSRRTLLPIRTFGGFVAPHIVAVSPDGRYAYVTDDSRGTVTVIRLDRMKLGSTVSVGPAAHHLSFSPDQRRVWIALGQSASRIAIVDTVDPARPRLIGYFSPGFPAHDLAFSPDGRRVWISSAGGPDVGVFGAGSRRLLFRVHVGAPPQHIAFAGRFVYLTSGYGSVIEQVDAATGRVIKRVRAPYGSFELAAADGYVATASLLRGTLAIYTYNLRLERVIALAPATREVVVSRP